MIILFRDLGNLTGPRYFAYNTLKIKMISPWKFRAFGEIDGGESLASPGSLRGGCVAQISQLL